MSSRRFMPAQATSSFSPSSGNVEGALQHASCAAEALGAAQSAAARKRPPGPFACQADPPAACRRARSQPALLLAKAQHRRGLALSALGRPAEALAAHRAGALAWPRRGDAVATAALRAAAAAASPEHVAEARPAGLPAAPAVSAMTTLCVPAYPSAGLAYHHGAKHLQAPAANQEHAPLPTAALRLITLYKHFWVCQRHAIRYASRSDPKRQLPHLSDILHRAPGAHTRHGWVQLWAARVEAAQTPLLLSSRDGRLLRPVPLEARLAPAALHAALARAAGGRLAADARDMLCDAWERGARQTACHAAPAPCDGLRFLEAGSLNAAGAHVLHRCHR